MVGAVCGIETNKKNTKTIIQKTVLMKENLKCRDYFR